MNIMQYSFTPIPNNNWALWAFYEKAFTPEECKIIRELFTNPNEATIANNVLNSDVRSSKVCWIHNNDEVAWIYEKLAAYIFDCNSNRYQFELTGFGEPLQLGKYEIGGHYKWHQDVGPNYTTRKLSLVLQLTDPSEYDGGELEFSGFDGKVNNGIGDLILFPSYNSHRVRPVTRGERMSLVAWLSGPPYR